MSEVEFFEEEYSPSPSYSERNQSPMANLLVRHGVVQNQRQGKAVLAGCVMFFVSALFLTFMTTKSGQPTSGIPNSPVPPDETRL